MPKESEKITVKKFSGETSVIEKEIPKAEPITGEELIAPIIPEMPEPTKSVIDMDAPDSTATASNPTIPIQPLNVPVVTDSEGTQFDPALHRTDADGNPRYGATGKFLKKYKTGQRAESSANQTTATSAGADEFDNGAEILLQTGYGICASFLTNDFRPESQEEHMSLKIPLAAFLREKGMAGMSSTQLLILSLAAYVSKKAAKPTVRDRFVLWYLKVRAFFKGEPQPKEPVKIEPNS